MLVSSGVTPLGADVFIAIEAVRIGLVLDSDVLSCIVPCGAVRIGESVVEDEERPAVLV